MLSYPDYLQLLPKAELHCHFVSTMRAERLVQLARTNGVALRTDDVDELFDYDNLADFLDVFNAAHEVLVAPADFATVAYEGVRDAVELGNLRYREYFVNPFNFRGRAGGGPDIPYRTLMDAIADGLRAAERDFGVGFRLVAAINRSHSAADAVALVEEVVAAAHPDVVGIGMDDLTPEKTEDPLRFAEAYALAGRHGLRRSAHAGETMGSSPQNVIDAIDVLGVDRVDHGYRVVDDPAALERALAAGIPFTCTPFSTRVLSGWQFDVNHRIAAMVRAGLVVTLGTDDAVFFSTDIAREYRDALPLMGIEAADARRIARAGFEASWCDDAQRARLLADFDAAALSLDALLAPGA